MANKSSSLGVLAIVDPRPLAKSSRLEFGTFRARGLPAVLLGVASIVVAAGLSAALRRSASMLPETLREARFLVMTARGTRGELPH